MAVRKIIPKKKGDPARKTAKVVTPKPPKKAKSTPKRVSLVGIVTDNSGSMQNLRAAATKDYNEVGDTIKKASEENQIDTLVSVVQCGVGTGQVRTLFSHLPVNLLSPMRPQDYVAEGRTPLFDAVGTVIDLFQEKKFPKNVDVSYLVQVTTDGEENASREWLTKLSRKIHELQATDRWTIVFRTTREGKNTLLRLGISEGNILVWEDTQQGMEIASKLTVQSVGAYYGARARGITSTRSFFQPDLNGVSAQQVKRNLLDISKETKIWFVKDAQEGSHLQNFCERQLGNGRAFRPGAAFYQLVKNEDVQSDKLLAVRDKVSGAIYCGDNARDLMGVPQGGDIKLKPGDHGQFDVYVQSKSYNRKLPPNTTVLYWEGAAVR